MKAQLSYLHLCRKSTAQMSTRLRHAQSLKGKLSEKMKVIELKATVTASNDRDAGQLRSELTARGQLLVNIMGSAGCGKTTLLEKITRDLKDMLRIAVIEADLDAQVDAERMEAAGAVSIQAHTDGMCHMDAGMTGVALETMQQGQAEQPQLIFLENVGNLICPAEYDTGAGCNIMLLSVPEGDDKPLKYPLMFQKSDALVITKTDSLPWFDFSMEDCVRRARALNPGIEIFPVSAKTGAGMEALEKWICGRTDFAGGDA